VSTVCPVGEGLPHIGLCCTPLALQLRYKVSKEMEITWFHTANWTCNWLWHYFMGVMEHRPYSPIIAVIAPS